MSNLLHLLNSAYFFLVRFRWLFHLLLGVFRNNQSPTTWGMAVEAGSIFAGPVSARSDYPPISDVALTLMYPQRSHRAPGHHPFRSRVATLAGSA
jgi:hypothetical protein